MTTKPLVERVNGIRLRAGQVWESHVFGPITLTGSITGHGCWGADGDDTYDSMQSKAGYTFIRGPVDGADEEIEVLEGQEAAQEYQAWFDRYGSAPQQPVVSVKATGFVPEGGFTAGWTWAPSEGFKEVFGEGDPCADALSDLNALTTDMPASGLSDTRAAMLKAMRRSVSTRASWPTCPVSGDGYVARTSNGGKSRNHMLLGELVVLADWTCPCCDTGGES